MARKADRQGTGDVGRGDPTPASPSRRTRTEQERNRKELADFLASVSHDLRSPLTSLREFLSIVEEGLAGPVNEKQREYLRIALRNANTLSEMLEHLLVMTEIRQDSFRLDRRRIRMKELLHAAALILGPRPRDKKIGLTIDVSDSLPDAYVDPDRLLEVVRNLVDNAIKYSGDEVTILVRVREGSRGQLELIVRDDGFGMDESTRKNLFHRSYRGRDAVRRGPGGLGIGLSIVKEIVALHEGRVRVRSKPGEGSEFVVVIPGFDPHEILARRLEQAWSDRNDTDGGFAFVAIEIESFTGALAQTREDAIQQVREVMSRTLNPPDLLLPECGPGEAICFLRSVGRTVALQDIQKILRLVAKRLRLQSSTTIEWESRPVWLHSDDFNHLRAMITPIHLLWCCKGERRNAA